MRRRFGSSTSSMRRGRRCGSSCPWGPVGAGHSPYSAPSAFAGNPLLIDDRFFVERGWVTDDDIVQLRSLPVETARRALRRQAFEELERAGDVDAVEELSTFQRDQRAWLDDWALYSALSKAHGYDWIQWPAGLRDREASAIAEARQEYGSEIRFAAFGTVVLRPALAAAA